MMMEQFAQAYEKAPDDKLTPVFVYTPNLFVRGQVITKENMRVSTWLRTSAMPEYVHLFDVQALVLGGGQPHSVSYDEMLVPTPQIAAFHLQPPAKDPIDYDETEQNRKMEPVAALIGSFSFFGHLRLATQITVGKSLEINRSTFLSYYDVKISNPAIPNMGTMSVFMTLIRPEYVYFGMKTH